MRMPVAGGIRCAVHMHSPNAHDVRGQDVCSRRLHMQCAAAGRAGAGFRLSVTWRAGDPKRRRPVTPACPGVKVDAFTASVVERQPCVPVCSEFPRLRSPWRVK